MSSDTAEPAVDGEDGAARRGGKKKPGKEGGGKEGAGNEGAGKPAADAGSGVSGEAPSTGPTENEDDLKSRFRDALKRKQAHGEVGAGYAKGEPKVHEVHGSTTRKRQFRRKSG